MLPYCGGPDFFHVNQGVSLLHRVSVPQVVFFGGGWWKAFSDQLELENAAY